MNNNLSILKPKTSNLEPKSSLPCVILAGGKSSRMGEDKAFLKIGDISLIEYQYNRLNKIFEKIYISAKSDKFNKKYNLILDNSDIYSPMIALKSILQKFQKVFIIPVDMPNISLVSIQKLLKFHNDKITIFKSKDKLHYLCGIFNNSLLPKIEHFLSNNNHKIGLLLKKTNLNYFEVENFETINLNYQENYINFLKNCSL